MSENNISVCQYVNMSAFESPSRLLEKVPASGYRVNSEEGITEEEPPIQLLNLTDDENRRVIDKSDKCTDYVNMSTCQYVSMSICKNATFQLSYQNESCSECQNDIRKHHISMSTCQYVNMSVCQYVRMSICRYVRMQLFSLGIKMKIVPNVIRRKL